MLVTDILNSCSNDNVAQAAVACIGGLFAERVRAVALENGLSVGRFVAGIVRDFASRADGEARAVLRARVAGADHPILDGLRHIVESALEERLFFDDDRNAFGPELVRRGESFCFRSGRFQGMLMSAL